jgi:hypothetical protein
MEYRAAQEVEQIATDLIEAHHEHLLGVRVECVFLSKTPKSKGQELWGRAKKVSGLPAFLAAGPEDLPEYYEDQPADFFVIEVAEEAWRELTAKGKRALVDKQLCSCEIEEDEESGVLGLAIVGPDVAEFEAVLRRHGLWNASIKDFVKTGAEQLTLTDAEETTPKPGETHTFSFKPEHMGAMAEAAGALRGHDG